MYELKVKTFTVRTSKRGVSAQCDACFEVTDLGAYRPTKRRFGHNVTAMGEWVDAHEHTHIRSEAVARREAERNWRNSHPHEAALREAAAVYAMTAKQIQVTRVESLAKELMTREKCFVCNGDPHQIDIRNDPMAEVGVLVTVACEEHEAAMNVLRPMTVMGYRIP